MQRPDRKRKNKKLITGGVDGMRRRAGVKSERI